MSICWRQSFKLPKKVLIFNKNSFSHYYSILSSVDNRVGCKNGVKSLSLRKINETNLLLKKKNFSLQSTPNIFDSLSSTEGFILVKKILVETHDFTGLPWYFTIIASSAALKLCVGLPTGIYQQYLVAKMELTKKELDGMITSLKEKVIAEGVKKKWSKTKIQLAFNSEVRKQKKILFVKNNCHPFKIAILALIQLPFWLLLTVVIRAFAVESYTGQSDYKVAALQFQVGGPFWCSNLSLPDPTFVLPTINFLTLLTITELNFMPKTTKVKTPFLINKVIHNFLRIFAIMFFFISAVSPSALSLFWVSNSVITLAVNLLYMSPRVRRLLKIPKTSSELDRPYAQIWNQCLEKFRFSRKEK